jgi:hypothetical protein
VKNFYLRAKLMEYISIIFSRAPKAASADPEGADEDDNMRTNLFMETLFLAIR